MRLKKIVASSYYLFGNKREHELNFEKKSLYCINPNDYGFELYSFQKVLDNSSCGGLGLGISDYRLKKDLELTIICEEDNGIESSYAVTYSNGEIMSEYLTIDGKLSIISSKSDINIGPGFEGDSWDEDKLIDIYHTIKNNYKESVITKSQIDISKLIKYLCYEINIINIYYVLSGIRERNSDFHSYLFSGRFDKEELDNTRKVLLFCFPDIDDITEKFEIIYNNHTVGLDYEGTGFQVLLVFISNLEKILRANETIIFSNFMNSIHPNLLNGLIKYYRKRLVDHPKAYVSIIHEELLS